MGYYRNHRGIVHRIEARLQPITLGHFQFLKSTCSCNQYFVAFHLQHFQTRQIAYLRRLDKSLICRLIIWSAIGHHAGKLKLEKRCQVHNVSTSSKGSWCYNFKTAAISLYWEFYWGNVQYYEKVLDIGFLSTVVDNFWFFSVWGPITNWAGTIQTAFKYLLPIKSSTLYVLSHDFSPPLRLFTIPLSRWCFSRKAQPQLMQPQNASHDSSSVRHNLNEQPPNKIRWYCLRP